MKTNIGLVFHFDKSDWEWFSCRSGSPDLGQAQADLDVIERCGLSSLLDMPWFTVNRGLLTALAERWHSDTNTFHFATGEMTVTLEDCYRILRIPIASAILPYE